MRETFSKKINADINPPVIETTVAGSAVTTMTVSGLDAEYLGGYKIHGTIKPAQVNSIQIYINGDTTVGNYGGYFWKFEAGITKNNAGYSFYSNTAVGDHVAFAIDIIPDATGRLMILSQSGSYTNALSCIGVHRYTITDNITSIGLSISSSGIDVGSFMRIARF